MGLVNRSVPIRLRLTGRKYLGKEINRGQTPIKTANSRHIGRETPLDCCLAIGALLNFGIDMIDILFKNDVYLRPSFIALARSFVQDNSAYIAGHNLGGGDRFLYPSIADLTINLLPLAFTCRKRRGCLVLIGLRRGKAGVPSINSTTINRLFITARVSEDTLPSEQSCSNSCFSRSTSLRTLVLFIVAMAILYHGLFRPPESLSIQRFSLVASKHSPWLLIMAYTSVLEAIIAIHVNA